uniref:Uncharacterized protein n=1 Tax=Oryza brachyantha TaxID=4533 RepID=J3N418_ORYBR
MSLKCPRPALTEPHTPHHPLNRSPVSQRRSTGATPQHVIVPTKVAAENAWLATGHAPATALTTVLHLLLLPCQLFVLMNMLACACCHQLTMTCIRSSCCNVFKKD